MVITKSEGLLEIHTSTSQSTEIIENIFVNLIMPWFPDPLQFLIGQL